MNETLPAPMLDGPTDVQSLAQGYVRQLVALAERPGTDAFAPFDRMDATLREKAEKRSSMMKVSLNALMTQSDDGGQVGKALLRLRETTSTIDPANTNFEANALLKALFAIPLLGGYAKAHLAPIRRYFMKFQSAEATIEAVFEDLLEGKAQLGRDCLTLEHDIVEGKKDIDALKRRIEFARAVDAELTAEAEKADEETRKFIEEKLLFAARKYVTTRQKKLLAFQQGIVASGVAIENNRELMGAVDNAVDVTKAALETAVKTALVLENQKIVLRSVKAVTDATDQLLMNTSIRLKTQGAEIHKMAADASISMDNLKGAFANVKEALEDVSTFRRKALPGMAQSILELDKMAAEGEEVIGNMDRALRGGGIEVALDAATASRPLRHEAI
jgi:uncharacterized protein YaaN involved in tellurite resistance